MCLLSNQKSILAIIYFGEELYCHITHLQVFLWKLWFTVSVKDTNTTMPRLQTSNLDTGHTRHVVMSN